MSVSLYNRLDFLFLYLYLLCSLWWHPLALQLTASIYKSNLLATWVGVVSLRLHVYSFLQWPTCETAFWGICASAAFCIHLRFLLCVCVFVSICGCSYICLHSVFALQSTPQCVCAFVLQANACVTVHKSSFSRACTLQHERTCVYVPCTFGSDSSGILSILIRPAVGRR